MKMLGYSDSDSDSELEYIGCHLSYDKMQSDLLLHLTDCFEETNTMITVLKVEPDQIVIKNCYYGEPVPKVLSDLLGCNDEIIIHIYDMFCDLCVSEDYLYQFIMDNPEFFLYLFNNSVDKGYERLFNDFDSIKYNDWVYKIRPNRVKSARS